MPNYKMQMGSHSQASDTTFKENDQEIIKSGPGYTRDGRPSKYPRSSGRFFYNNSEGSGGATPKAKNAAGLLSYLELKSDLAKKMGGNTPADNSTPPAKKPTGPKPYVKPGGKATGSIKNYAIGSDARRKEYDARGWAYDSTIKRPKAKAVAASSLKSKPVSISTGPKLTPSISNITSKQTIASPQAKTPKVKQSKPNVKKADKNFSKMVKLRTKANIISGDDSMSDKKKQRKLGRLRKRYDRQATKHKQNRPSIGDAFKVNL